MRSQKRLCILLPRHKRADICFRLTDLLIFPVIIRLKADAPAFHPVSILIRISCHHRGIRSLICQMKDYHRSPGSLIIFNHISLGIHFHFHLCGIPALWCIVHTGITQILETPSDHFSGRIKSHPIWKKIIKYQMLSSGTLHAILFQIYCILIGFYQVAIMCGQAIFHLRPAVYHIVCRLCRLISCRMHLHFGKLNCRIVLHRQLSAIVQHLGAGTVFQNNLVRICCKKFLHHRGIIA